VLPRLSGLVLVVTGVYLVVYWAPALSGGVAYSSRLAGYINEVASLTGGWVSANQGVALGVAAGTVILALVASVLAKGRSGAVGKAEGKQEA
jgi:hypothetical protein